MKDTLGAGSIGVEIMNSYEEVESFLNSDRNNSDIMVEELIQGEQFGTEIHGVEGRYSVLPPIAFSVTKEGITDPLSSVNLVRNDNNNGCHGGKKSTIYFCGQHTRN